MLLRENSFTADKQADLRSLLETEFLFFKKVSIEDFADRERILVNNKVCTDLSKSVKEGTLITVLTPQSFEPKVSDDVTILYEDAALLVVNKPAPLPIHPAGKYYFNTLTSLLERNFKKKVFPVHRLDKETSGVMVFAKSAEVAEKLSEAFRTREVEKEYLAVVKGHILENGVWSYPLLKKQQGIIRNHMVTSPEGQEATTEYEVLARTQKFSVLLCKPITGKRHQIRAHAAIAGHTLVGDKQYGAYPEKFEAFVLNPDSFTQEQLVLYFGAPRQLLHASRISFSHPISGKICSFFAEIPQDFASFCSSNNLILP